MCALIAGQATSGDVKLGSGDVRRRKDTGSGDARVRRRKATARSPRISPKHFTSQDCLLNEARRSLLWAVYSVIGGFYSGLSVSGLSTQGCPSPYMYIAPPPHPPLPPPPGPASPTELCVELVCNPMSRGLVRRDFESTHTRLCRGLETGCDSEPPSRAVRVSLPLPPPPPSPSPSLSLPSPPLETDCDLGPLYRLAGRATARRRRIEPPRGLPT